MRGAPSGGAGGRRRRLAAALLASLFAAGGCEHAFEPFQSSAGTGFSMFGYLDLYADTQWVRVMPVRQNTFLTPEPIDAVVTLEHLGSGRVVELRDSLISFPDPELGTVAYAHNFWTTERLEPQASYRLTATRSDGAVTSARVTLPSELHLTFSNDVNFVAGSTSTLFIQAEEVVFVDIVNWVYADTVAPTEPQRRLRRIGTSHEFRPAAYPLDGRQELRITAASAEWPYQPEDSDLAVSLQGRLPTNVEDGYGFVGGVAVRTIPFHRCEVVVRRVSSRNCEYTYHPGRASLAGRVIREPCGEPHAYQTLRLIERFPDGAISIRHWLTGADGEYRYEGIEPGAELTLEVRLWAQLVTYPLTVPPVPVPTLAPGQRYEVEDILVPVGC